MTVALKNVIEKINRLPSDEQNALAKLLSEELAWDKSFARSQKELASLANEALAEYGKGKTQPLSLK